MATGTLEKIAAALGGALQDLETHLSPDVVVGYFQRLGAVFPDSLPTQVDFTPASGAAAALGPIVDDFTAADAANDALGVVAAGVRFIPQLKSLFDAIDAIAGQIDAQADSFAPLTAAEVHDFTGGLTKRILDDTVIRQFEILRPEYVHALVLVGVIDRFSIPVAGADADEPPVFSRQLRLERLPQALSSPSDYLKGLVGWGTNPFDPTALLERVEAFLALFTSSIVIDNSSGTPVLEASLLTLKENTTTTPPGVDLAFHLPLPDGFTFTIPVRPGYAVNVSITGGLPEGAVLTISPPSNWTFSAPVTLKLESKLSRTPFGSETAVVLLGQTGATRLEADAIHFSVGIVLNPGGPGATGDIFFKIGVDGARVVADFSQGDGLLTTLTGGGGGNAHFDLAATWSVGGGFHFEAGGGLELRAPVHVHLGPIELVSVFLSLAVASGQFPLELSAELRATLGPVILNVDRVGFAGDLSFPSGRGNLGPAELDIRFKLPSAIGVTVDAGSVRGGGFLAIDQAAGRYSGALELSVFSISVKAFGLLDTKFPDGSKGVSFVIVIVAEFTPIQLGFGFTLLGVGGMVAVQRTVNTQALADAVRTGSLEHLLFPRNPVADAPAIIHDLATVFPPARDHFVLGPLGKLGWGTPTLITADLGVVIELPGPRIAVLGVLHMLLPSPDAALLKLQMAVVGILDFPAQEFSLDASLYDSVVVSYPVSGDMAFRLGFGKNAKFLLSVGGFNAGFDAPPGFPTLRRVSVDLGVHGNPSLVASGYFALTSNTAQIGASIELNASGAGIRLHGWLGFDVMFVFSPFSFTASISAGVRVSFHGAGFGITLRGTLSGPSPWHLNGQVCVSILWWDACLGIDLTFGENRPAALPEIDPWFGLPSPDPRLNVRGLSEAILDARSWSGASPPAGLSVVTLSAAATAERTPIDPLGAAELRQRVAPLEIKLSKFGEYRPKAHDTFSVTSVAMNGEAVTDRQPTTDDFVPGHFFDLSNADKLSMPSYVPMQAGFSIQPSRVTIGSSGSQTLEYETKLINAEGQLDDNQPVFHLTQAQLRGLLRRSAGALGGARRTGSRRYSVPGKKVTFGVNTFVVVDSCSSARNTAITPGEVSQIQAFAALRAHVAANPQDQGRFTVIPTHLEVA